MVAHPVHYTFREYVAHEGASSTKHEYLDGQIYAMAGGTPEHSALIASVMSQIANQIRGGPCRLHVSDLRIRVAATGLATYPDVTVLCGPWERDRDDPNTIVNPTVIVEVLSPSTEAYDRGEKIEHYKRIPTLRACLLFAHDRREIELWTRTAPDAPWARVLAISGERAEIVALGVSLDVDHIYEEAREPG
jgi:Uma2 family endonuclease